MCINLRPFFSSLANHKYGLCSYETWMLNKWGKSFMQPMKAYLPWLNSYRCHRYLYARLWKYRDVSKSSRTVLVKRSLLTLHVTFVHRLQSTPLLYEYSSPSISAVLWSIPGGPFLELCQVPAVIPLKSLQWCRIFNPSSKTWGRGKSQQGARSGEYGGSLSCCSWPKTGKL